MTDKPIGWSPAWLLAGERGRPEWLPSDKERGLIQGYSTAGYTQDEIADRLGVDAKTLRKHCRKELDFGLMDLIVGAVNALGRMAIGAPAQFDDNGNKVRDEVVPQLGAICFLLKTRGKKLGWTERLELSGKDGGPLLPELEALMAKLNPEQLALVERVQNMLSALVSGNADADPGQAGDTQTKH